VKLVGELARIVLAKIATNKLVLPVMPKVAQDCLATLRDPRFQQRKFTSALEREPLLAASVLKNAMSAAHAGAAVKTLDQAVSALGMDKLKSLIVEFMTRQLFQSSNPRIQAATKHVWEHSLAVATLARDIAAMTTGANSDTCYLAGLLHDVGKPVLAAMMLEAEKMLSNKSGGGPACSTAGAGAKVQDKPSWVDAELWTSTIEQGHRQVGTALAKEWKLPDDVTAGIRDCTQYDTANPGGAANVVRFANALAKREGFATGPFAVDEVEARIEVGRSMIGADQAMIERIVAGLAERVAQEA
jgi:putative nucleotidyltransferase with HDIG domain